MIRFLLKKREELDFKFALVWHPVKRGRAVIKPVPGAMQFVAKTCVEIIRSYGNEARSTARWIMDNPGKIPIASESKDLLKCRETGVITHDQIKRLLGVEESKPLGDVSVWNKNFTRTRLSRRPVGSGASRVNHYDFEEMQKEWWVLFQRKWWAAFGVDWPYSVKTDTYKLTADQTLLLIYEGALRPSIENRSKIFFDTPSPGSLSALFSGKGGMESIWRRLGIRLPDGSFPSIQSHDLRHFLNTMAQRAGIPEPLIALWSGRASLAQNSTYDHRTDSERLQSHAYHETDYDEVQAEDLLARQVVQAFSGEISAPSVQILSSSEATVRELTKRLIVSITQFGFCVGDLKSDPCPHAMNCLSCSRLVVCKGAPKAKALIEQKIERLEGQRKILLCHLENEGGRRLRNENILPHLEKQIDGAKDMLMAINDPNLPKGSIIARADSEGTVPSLFSERVTLFMEQQKEAQIDSANKSDG